MTWETSLDSVSSCVNEGGMRCTQRLQELRFWGPDTSLPGSQPRGGAPIRICTPEGSKRVRWGMVSGRGREGSLGLQGPPACADRHSSSVASWGCAGALPRVGCPSSPCRTHLCPPLPSPAHSSWPRAKHFGEQGAFQVCRQAESWLGDCVP